MPNLPSALNDLPMDKKDVEHHLHSYTNLKVHAERGPLTIVAGRGVFVVDKDGNEYLEGMSGLWSAALGFSNERLAKAAYDQLRRLPFYHTFNHRTNEPAAQLAERLKHIAPVPISKVFFASSGSEANDTAIKMIWYFNHAQGRPRKRKIVSRLNAYHGVTVASGSLTGLALNHRSFGLPMDGIVHTMCPHHYRFGNEGESEGEFVDRCAAELERLVVSQGGADEVAAMFCEPVMGSGGVIIPPAGYYEKVQAICRKYDMLMVADEVICGFGRTGNAWGSQTVGLEPDIMTCAKALSASFLPISAVMVNDKVYQTLMAESGKIGMWGHGFTYSGHPAAAAVALEAQKIYEEMDLFGHARDMGKVFQSHIKSFVDHPLVGEAMGVGMLGALEIVAQKDTKEKFDPIAVGAGNRIIEHALRRGLILRNIGERIAVCPPLIINRRELDDLFGRLRESLDATLADLTQRRLDEI